ncbi:MAG: class I SAM-dependent methyltransferase [Sphingomonadaceae bacterium]
MKSESPSRALRYSFLRVERCNMCRGRDFRMLGMRLNRSQGMRPRSVPGIATSVMQCRSCSLIFANPLPVPARLDDHYGLPAESYWKEHYFSPSPAYFARQIAHAGELLGPRENPRALDIGAGIGKAMAALAAAGYDCHGIEPSASFRDVAIARGGIAADRIALATLEEAEYPAEFFDFITFGAVLEHLYDPAAAIERVLPWLRPGGVVQIEVPSSRHLVQRIINAYFRLRGTNYVTHLSPMHPPFHLYEFGLESFRRHAARAGYRIARHYFDVCTIYHLPRIVHPPLRWLMERTDRGMQLTVYLMR